MADFLKTTAALAVALGMGLATTPAQAEDDSQLYFVNGLDVGLMLYLDSAKVGQFPPQWRVHTPARSGSRTIKALTGSGLTPTSQKFEFRDADLASGRDGRFWCVVLAQVNGAKTMVQLPREKCGQIVKAAEAEAEDG